MTQESTRADFENWIRKHRPYENIRRKFESDPYPPGVQCYWEGWQAAIEADRKRITELESQLEGVLSERDAHHDMADQLSEQIAAITGQEIGEHSSGNDPWQNAMLAADEWIAEDLRKLTDGSDRKRRGNDQQPFGYFRPDPFGWTHCAATDEGAIALYERPQERGEPVAWKEHAAKWLRKKAAEQQATNEQYPEHAKHYPTWETWVLKLNWLADELSEPLAPQPAEPVIRNSRNTADPVKVLSKDEIRAVLLKHGYTIKPGHDDLKPYVYAAARELIALAQGREP